LECQVLRTVLQLFDHELDAFTADSTQSSLSLSHMQLVDKTDSQQIPEMQLTSAEMMDRFKKIIVTAVNFVLFSGQCLLELCFMFMFYVYIQHIIYRFFLWDFFLCADSVDIQC